MKSKTASTLVLVLFAFFIAPVCSIAQTQTSSDVASAAAIPMLAPNIPASPLPTPADATMGMVTAPNSIYLELLGSGIIYSLNYERMLINSLALRVGFGYAPLSASSTNNAGVTKTATENITTAPLTLSWFPFSSSTSSPSSKLEIGAGIVYVDLTKKLASFPAGNSIGYTAILGYRYQPADGGFLFRIAFTPFILFNKTEPWGGITFGYGF
jgi:hypothetical protein